MTSGTSQATPLPGSPVLSFLGKTGQWPLPCEGSEARLSLGIRLGASGLLTRPVGSAVPALGSCGLYLVPSKAEVKKEPLVASTSQPWHVLGAKWVPVWNAGEKVQAGTR